MQIRPAVVADLPALTALYNHYVENTVATFDLEPYTVAQRADWFGHYGESGPHRLLVGERDDQLVGYVCSSPFRPKAAYAQSVETSVYLDPEQVGRGDGRRLYEALFDELSREPVHRAYACIALPNERSVRLHERLGFTPVGVWTEVGFKFERWVDVGWWELALPLTTRPGQPSPLSTEPRGSHARPAS